MADVGPWPMAVAARRPLAQTALGVDIIKQYPGPEQIELKVVNHIPGSWFTWEQSNAGERRDHYQAQAVEYKEVMEFPGAGPRSKKTREAAIRFICLSDAQDDAGHDGFWMKLSQWNRYRHYTYKDRREDELPFIKALPVGEETPKDSVPAPEKPKGIKDFFTCVETGEHQQGDGIMVPCSFFVCTQPNCKQKKPIKEIKKNTGLLYRHLEKCNPVLWRELRLSSKHSKLRQGENGEAIEVRPL